ncbi:MAG: DUF1972 domain-containing protein [Solirubrobacteraceae bacterium]
MSVRMQTPAVETDTQRSLPGDLGVLPEAPGRGGEDVGPLKIAIIGSRGYPSTYGGYETLVRYVARRWVEEGHSVTVYCRNRDPDGRRHWHQDGVECIWTAGRDSNSASTLTFGLSSHLHARTRRFDAALVLNIANGFFLPLLATRGIPSVLNTDGLEWQRGKWGPIAQKVFYKGALMSAKHADVLVSDSQAIGAIWKDEFGVQPRFIPYGGVVHNSVRRERLAEVGVRRGEYVLVVARLIPENNVELTLDALDRMPDRPPAVIVGSANCDGEIDRRLRQLDQDGRVRWLGHVDDQELLTQLWANCGVYVHGHSVGGTNPALLQALGAGAPTLALDTPFNNEVIKLDHQLYPHDADALATAIGRVLDSRSTQRSFAVHGRKRVADDYDWDAVAAGYLDALLCAREARRGRPRRGRHLVARRPRNGVAGPSATELRGAP